MNGLPLWQWIVNVGMLLVGGAAGSWFIARYAMTYRWWKNEWGRHIITFSGCVTLFYLYFILVVIWPNLPGKALIRSVLFLCLTLAIVWRAAMFERTRHKTRTAQRSDS